jgi:cytochrome c554/c'-like protein
VFQEKYPGVPVIYVDAGDFTGDPNEPGRRQTEALVEAMNTMGYRVSALGLRELAQGWEVFAARRAKAKFPFVSANIVWQDTAEPVVDPFVVIPVPVKSASKTKEVRFAFTGLATNNPAFLKTGPGDRKIVTIDPIAAGTKIIPAMRAKADVVVILAAIDIERARTLARQTKEADLIIGGLGAGQTRSDDFPEDSQFGKTRIQYIGDQGKNLGEIRMTFAEKAKLAKVQRVVVGLTRDWPDQPEMARVMAATKETINDYNRAQAEAQNPFTSPAAAAAPGVAAVPGSAAATAPGIPVPPPAAVYTGSARCKECHQEQFEQWAGTSHARAFDILVKNSQDFNPQCVGCHVIGYGRPSGFVNARATPGLIHVGCESCHGPSSLHPDKVGQGYGVTDTKACRSCHTAENSPDFNPDTYIPKVRHWDEARAAR